MRRRVGDPGEGKHVFADLVAHVDLRLTERLKLVQLTEVLSVVDGVTAMIA